MSDETGDQLGETRPPELRMRRTPPIAESALQKISARVIPNLRDRAC